MTKLGSGFAEVSLEWKPVALKDRRKWWLGE
jgi:hypothetical protein